METKQLENQQELLPLIQALDRAKQEHTEYVSKTEKLLKDKDEEIKKLKMELTDRNRRPSASSCNPIEIKNEGVITFLKQKTFAIEKEINRLRSHIIQFPEDTHERNALQYYMFMHSELKKELESREIH